MVSLFFFLLYISVININLCQPPSNNTFSKKHKWHLWHLWHLWHPKSRGYYLLKC